jgi:hypothetical protein
MGRARVASEARAARKNVGMVSTRSQVVCRVPDGLSDSASRLVQRGTFRPEEAAVHPPGPCLPFVVMHFRLLSRSRI